MGVLFEILFLFVLPGLCLIHFLSRRGGAGFKVPKLFFAEILNLVLKLNFIALNIFGDWGDSTK